ncbi:MAG: hypothetical protein PVG32_13290, partial [Anaerolineales bacterium]
MPAYLRRAHAQRHARQVQVIIHDHGHGRTGAHPDAVGRLERDHVRAHRQVVQRKQWARAQCDSLGVLPNQPAWGNRAVQRIQGHPAEIHQLTPVNLGWVVGDQDIRLRRLVR